MFIIHVNSLYVVIHACDAPLYVIMQQYIFFNILDPVR